MTNDQVRANALGYCYERNKSSPGNYIQTSEIVAATGFGLAEILEAQQYLVDKGLLASREHGQQIRSLGHGLVAMMARITADGLTSSNILRTFTDPAYPQP
ncbi:MAG TPA: hypothetical protein VGF98_05465 [Candidatus Tumulicola sp.]|jgi:hypothetical protein